MSANRIITFPSRIATARAGRPRARTKTPALPVIARLAACLGLLGASHAARAQCGSAPLLCNNPAALDEAGSAVATLEDMIIMGVARKDTNSGFDAGAVYIYHRDGAEWPQLQYISPNSLNAQDYFGWSVSASPQTLAIGARGDDTDGLAAGAVWIYEPAFGIGPLWTPKQKITAGNRISAGDQFGYAVDVDESDGKTVAVGAPYFDKYGDMSGAIFIYKRVTSGNTTTWEYDDHVYLLNPPPGVTLGRNVSMYRGLAANGVPEWDDPGMTDRGRVFAFRWTQYGFEDVTPDTPQSVVAGDEFGAAAVVAPHVDYNIPSYLRLYVGAPGTTVNGLADAGVVYMFDFYEHLDQWYYGGMLTADTPAAGARFGESIAASAQTLAIADRARRVHTYFSYSTPALNSVRTVPTGALDTYTCPPLAASTSQVIAGGPKWNGAGLNDTGGAFVYSSRGSDQCGSYSYWNQLYPGVSSFGCTDDATTDGAATCGNSSSSPDVWYVTYSIEPRTYILDTSGSTFDTVLSVHDGCPGTIANQVACDDDGGEGTASRIVFTTLPGVAYYVRIAGFAGASGSYVITCEEQGASTCPADMAPAGGDGAVDVTDLLTLLGAWGVCGPGGPCPPDIAPPGGDGVVDVSDLLDLLAAWGACP